MADSGSGNGLTFDAGFTANHWITIGAGGSAPEIFVDYANLVTLTGSFAGKTTPGNSTLTEGNSSVSISATLNNSNTAGVTATTAPNDAASVATGIELSIALVDLGYTGGPIRVAAFINGSSQDFLSNQVLGFLPAGTANLGEPRNVNFNNLAGEQFFVVIPEPSSLSLLCVGVAAAALRRPRKK
jgi:hypothetical protein